MFSSRRAAVTAGVAELAAAYDERHGRPPSARALFSMAQYVTLNSRRAKPKKSAAPTRAEMLAGVGRADERRRARRARRHPRPGRSAPRTPPRRASRSCPARRWTGCWRPPSPTCRPGTRSWSRGQLLAAIDAQLPGWLGGLDAAAVRYVLEDLTDRALARHGVVSLEAADLVPVPAALLRADGRSVYTPHDRGLFTTRPHLDAEEQLMTAAGQTDGPAADPDAAAAALGAVRAELEALPGRVPPRSAAPDSAPDHEGGAARSYAGGLRPDQAAAVYGILTSGRPADILIGPAGTGKSRTMGTLAGLWPELAGGRVVGVATAEIAAQVLAAEGIGRACNIARFIAAAGRGAPVLGPGDLLVVDEASMVATADMTALHAIAAAAGAKMLLTGDPAQLPAVGAGGALGMLAREHGYHQLTQVQRMREEWERDASLRLRDGDASVLADYDRHGRLAEGTAEQMGEAAYRAWLADHLAGRDTLLIASTNEQAAELSARARGELAALGIVEEHGRLPLADGAAAGRGDLVQARRNDRDILDADGRWAANRDLWRIDGYEPDPRRRQPAAVRAPRPRPRPRHRRAPVGRAVRRSPPTTWQRTPSSATPGTAPLPPGPHRRHRARGRDRVPRRRALVYVAMTRGRDANYAYVATDPAAGRPPDPGRALGDDAAGQRRATDLRPGTRPAPALATPGRDVPEPWREHASASGPGGDATAPWAPEADRLSVLAAALEREETEPTAIDTRRDDAARAGHMAHLGAIWADLAARGIRPPLRRRPAPPAHPRSARPLPGRGRPQHPAPPGKGRRARRHPAERLLARAAGCGRSTTTRTAAPPATSPACSTRGSAS